MKEIFLKRYFLPQNLVFFAIALVIAFGLKYHYSHADANDLVWILAPTAGLVEMVLPVDFELEKDQGFICRKHSIVIAPACAGVNFMIISFCMIAFYGTHCLYNNKEKFLWFFFSLTGSYVITLVINAFRIILSIYLYESRINIGWFTPSRIHLTAGIFIYVSCLYGAYFAVQLILRKYQLKAVKKKTEQAKTSLQPFAEYRALNILIPMIWYWLITLGVPFLNGGFKKSGNLFWEHAATVMVICAFICLTFLCIRLFFMKLKVKIPIHKTIR
ncbi:MAG: exosortase K [Proteobacteria bacterium]|nr:exosortase K [Pseudomonadota bacterium]MBU4011737.1 exosortase K [Pseudomonadota bacterium]